MAKLKIAYFTVQAPYGPGEAFIITEMLGLKAQKDVELWIAPLRPQKQIRHHAAEELVEQTLKVPLFNLKVLLGALKALFLQPRQSLLAVWKVIRHSRPGVLLKNLVVVPKSLYLGRVLREKGVQHIHAHWASTPSTCAYIASLVSGIPWSFTAHRWDIAENNMLKEKVRSAHFVRVISQDGREEMQRLTGQCADKIKVIHMGVKVSRIISITTKKGRVKTIVCIANLVEKKGHRYLLEACALLKSWGIKFRCILVGDGPLRAHLQRRIQSLGLEAEVEMRGAVAHEEVLHILRDEADVMVLPSIVTEQGEREGIPVTLMEAMAYGVPVVSTRTGGIPELLSNGAGVLVEEKNPRQLAEVLRKILKDERWAKSVATEGYRKVYHEYNSEINLHILIKEIKSTLHQREE